MKLTLPEILNIPDKMLPMITEFNSYKYFLGEGGRGSGKSQSVGRFILYLAEKRKIRVVCGREIQANIEESVFTLLLDLVDKYNLAFDVKTAKGNERLTHKVSGSEINFKGFREQGRVSIKGLEGVDILWIDEAQSITKLTLETIIPTLRVTNPKMFFTMNPFMRDDAVPEFCKGRSDTLAIKVNYHENQFCPLTLKVEAENMRIKSARDFNHIWMGVPLQSADDYLFNYTKLHNAYEIKPFGENPIKQRVLGIDIAAQGNDQCVATIIDRKSNQHWQVTERIPWDEPDTMVSTGKIVELIGTHKPDITIIDKGNMGLGIYNRLNELGLPNIHAFDGGSTRGINIKEYANIRAAGYHRLRDWFDSGFLCIDKKKDSEIIKQLEKIRFKYRSNGSRLMESKVDMKSGSKGVGYSPDDADSLMMAVWGATTILGKGANSHSAQSHTPRRVNKSTRGQRPSRR